LKAVHTVIYEFRGITRIESKVDFKEPKESNFKAKITDSISEEFDLLGYKEAFIDIFTGFHVGKSFGTKSGENFKNLVGEKNKTRKENFKKGVFLIFQGEVEVPEPSREKIRSTSEVSFAINAFPKGSITKKFQKDLNFCLSTILLSANETSSLEIEKIGSVTYLENEIGSLPVFLINVEMKAKATIGSNLPDKANKTVPEIFKKIQKEPTLESALKLFLRSTLKKNGDIKSFIDAWLALEKLVNKKFRGFYKNFWINNATQDLKDFVEETSENYERIIKKNYNLRDKFLIISAELSQKDAKKDYMEFCEIQDLRGDIYHDRGFDEEALPLDKMQKLFKKYLKLHLEKK